MNHKVIKGLLIFLSVSANAQTQSVQKERVDPVNTLSKTYQEEARYTFSENDVKSFVYQWFAAFDHQREAGYFLNRIATPIKLQYPDFPITSQSDFLRWYKGVTDNIVWNSHSINSMAVSGDQKSGWNVSYNVNWKAKTKDGQHYDLVVRQALHIIRIGDALKIARLTANVLDQKK